MSRFLRKPDRWSRKFVQAGRGVAAAFRRERNFAIHLPAALVVVVAAAVLRASLVEWCLLVLSIVVVLAAEMFNTAIEHLARAITAEENSEIREALHTAAGGVLAASIGAAIVGALILIVRLASVFGFWN
jgi:diacylglycerol kinase (ATP)